MKLIVNYDNLRDVSSDIRELDERIQNIHKEIQSLCDRVHDYWTGTDSDVFVSKFTDFINNEKIEEKEIENLSVLLDKICDVYQNKNEEWGSDMNHSIERKRVKTHEV